MSQEFIAEFVDNSLMVRTSNGTIVINQPFVPDGNQTPWENQEQAMAWWDSRKTLIIEEMLSPRFNGNV